MSDLQNDLGVYLHLALASQRRLRTLERDKMLVLAGVTAAELDLPTVAACCRSRIIAHNPGHLVSQYPSLSAALEDERFQNYLRQLRRGYSREKLEHMLLSLGIVMAAEREAYYSDYEYAAALLGATPEELDERYGEDGRRQHGTDVRQSTLIPPDIDPRMASAASRFGSRPAPKWVRRFLPDRLHCAAAAACLIALVVLIVVIAVQF